MFSVFINLTSKPYFCMPMVRERGFQYLVDSKMVLDASLLNTRYNKVLIKGKWSNPRKGVTPSPTFQCSSYEKRSLRVVLDNSQSTYIYIYYTYD